MSIHGMPLSSTQPPDSPAPLPHLLEGVVTLRRISAGAYGTVYLGRDAAHRELAVKVLNPDVPESGRARERQGLVSFLEEFQNGDDHLLTIHQISPAGPTLCYSMELADNLNDPYSSDDYAAATLGAWLDRHGPPPMETLVDWMHQLLEGVAALHAHGLIHRDLKPGNLYFVRGRLKLGDYGLVCRWKPDSTLIGTQAYIPGGMTQAAPEMDLYALGKILYTMATGLPVGEYPRIPERRMDDRALRQLNQFLMECACSLEPGNRFHTAQAFREGFDQVCDPATRAQKSQKLRRRLFLGAQLAFVAVLVGALVFLALHVNSLRPEEEEYLPVSQQWHEQIPPVNTRMSLRFHQEKPAVREVPGGIQVLPGEACIVPGRDFELYCEVTSGLRQAELQIRFQPAKPGEDPTEIHAMLTPRGVFSETTLLAGEPRGEVTWGLRVVPQGGQWLLLANGRPVLDVPDPATTPPWKLSFTLLAQEGEAPVLRKICLFATGGSGLD